MPYVDYFNEFAASESVIGRAFAPVALVGKAIYKFNSNSSVSNSRQRVPMFVRTGQQSFGTPAERKRFTQIEFHGKGTLYVRIYVDGIWISDATVTLSESPSKDRRVGIPTGTRGYVMDIEFAGDADLRAIEFEYKPMQRSS